MRFLIYWLRLKGLKERMRFLGISLVLLVGLLTITSYSFTQYRQTETNQINSMRMNGAIQQTTIDSWFATRASEIRILANLQTYKNIDLDSIQQNMNFFMKNQHEFEALSYVNKEGIVEFSTMNQIGVYFSDRTFYDEALKGKEYISDVLMGKVSKQPTILFSAPIIDVNNQFLGAVYGTVTLETIDHFMDQFQNGNSGESYLMDTNGYLITDSRFAENRKKLEFKNESEILKRAKIGIESAAVYTNYRSNQVFGTYQLVNNSKWIAVSEIEKNEVLHSFYQQLMVMSVIIFIVLAIGLIGMLQLAKHIEQPIQMLLRGVSRLQNGEYDYQIHYSDLKTAPMELIQLCEAFNQMSQNIHENELQLKQQKEDLAVSNGELEQFAYVASHDLQEPLRMVASYVQLLAKRYKGKLDQDADDFIHYAVDGSQRMQSLINDLLAFSRVGSKGKEFKIVDLGIVLQHVLANLQQAILENGAVITHDTLPTLTADPTQIAQLLQNLIGNAIKFNDASRIPTIHIGVQRVGEDWQISVQDNGIGFDSQYKERIFLIFQRLHTKSKYSGTGIGLSICKKIVERHGGKIWVESEMGLSTTFYFKLPDRGDQQI
ncbi:HAMP domain-containing protein [Paenibacillus psychroresistens]|uniref:histidine kinase n=1 Tax=Paenibacillus psychroresistens TaxID=1778678 RepID=A0A6B8RVM9_9BACL|nr:ATP-binding protein [Paenibacillus psychroresistens]QGQ99493.1 HAMP domain-containing protein [Paenibacillus psychroresistens]